MALNTIGVTLTLDGEQEYKQALKAINAEQKELRTEMELSSATHKENANSLEALQEKYDLLTKKIEAQKDRIEVYETAISKNSESQAKAAKDVESYSNNLELLNEDLKKLEESGEASNEQIEEQKKKISDAEDQLRRAQLAYADCGAKIDDYQMRLNVANTQMVNWQEELQDTGKYLKEAEASTDKCATSIDNFGKEIKEAGEESQTAGNDILNGIGSILIADGIEKLADVTAKAGKSFLELATNAAFYADEINTLSTNTGVAIDTIQALKYSEELLDTSLETVTSAMAKNIKSMDAANKGSEAYADTYKKLGISVTDANGELRDSEEVFWEVIDALGKMDNATEKDAASMQLFGRNAQSLNSLIAAGSKGFQEMYQEASDLGYIMDKETIDSLTRTSNAIERVSKTADAFKNKIGADVAPVVEEAANELSTLMMEHEEEVVEIIEDVIPDLVKGLEFVADNLDTIVPIVEMVGMGFAAFKTASVLTTSLNSVLALLPPTLNGATIAQEELNAAQAASPVGAIAAGMALLMTALVEIAKASAEYTPKVIELTDKEKALVDSINAVRDATKESAEAFSSNVESISTNKTQAAGLLEKLKELAPEAKNDAAKMQEMQSVVDKLNVMMPDLGLSINSVTGELNQGTEAVDAYVEALFKQAEVEAYQERIKETLQEQIDINNTLIEQEGAYNEAVKKNQDAWDEYYSARDEYEKALAEYNEGTVEHTDTEILALKELMETSKEYASQVSEETFGQIKGYEDLQRQVGELEEETQGYKDLLMDTGAEEAAAGALADMSQGYVEWRGYAVEATGDVSTKLEELEQAYGEAKTAAEDSLRSQMGLFDEYTIESQSLDDMTKGLESQTDAMTQYGDNLQKALDLNIDPQIIASIEEMGISGAGYLQALVDAAEEGGAAMDDFMAAWEANQKALNGLSEAMAEFEVGYGETLGRVVETGEESAQTMLEDQEAFSEQYVQSWDDTGAAVALSIEESQPIVIENVKTMASMAVTTLNTELGITDGKSSKGYDAGTTFMKSIGQAVLDMEDELVGDVASVGRKMVDEAKEWTRKVDEALGESL
ncbi:MAG: hypothetical protein K6G19_02890 [Lachnospiraceae bacterium]|nr:hypothetical protein [Lachnospiraceae bacterium]